MKKIILVIITFMIFLGVNAEEIDPKEYDKASVRLNEAYDKFIGACNNGERVAIIKYAKGDIDKVSGGFSLFKTLRTNDGKEINDFCANYAEDLYEAIKSAEPLTKDINLKSILLETEVTIKTNVFVNGSRITSRGDLTIIEDCKLISNDFKKILKEYLGYFQVAFLAVAIILCIVDLYKLLISKEIDSKKAFKKIKGRLIALVIFLLAPVIINIIIDLINSYVNVEAIKCLES